MKEANELFDKLINSGKDLNKCKVGKVVKFNASEMKADIQPLPSSDNSLLINVPVMTFKTGSFFIRAPLEKDDIVLVLFADNDLDNILLGGDNVARDRKHDLSDAICMGGITLFNNPLPGEHSEDLIITNNNLTSKVIIKKDGDLIVQGENVYLGNESASEGVPLGNSLKSWLDSHTHPGTESPTSPSPDPSKVVKVL